MAFEIARVHQLICSRVGDGMDVKAFNDESASVEAEQTFSWSCSPQSGLLHAHFPADLSSSFGGFEQGSDGGSVPVELSSCSTETESDEDDELLQSLAQQIAHSMLDEETNVETGVGGGKGNGCSEARNLSHVEVNEVSTLWRFVVVKVEGVLGVRERAHWVGAGCRETSCAVYHKLGVGLLHTEYWGGWGDRE